ncbi:MAG: acyl-CoA thioesterase [Cyclobacteriaceae bacterium]|nr:acyl-CoA thioesterase [Cyclobacteriaceae bacterium]
MELAPKSPSASETTITELMIPSYANFGGKIHGGILLGLMDKVAYACAAKHTGSYCVTVSVENVEFLAPVEVGQLVSLKARINYVGRTSLVVGIRVESEDIKTGQVTHTNTSYFTMVAKDDHNKPTLVRPLLLQNKEEVRRFFEAIIRKNNRNFFKEEMEKARINIDLDEELSRLEGERCVIDFEA